MIAKQNFSYRRNRRTFFFPRVIALVNVEATIRVTVTCNNKINKLLEVITRNDVYGSLNDLTESLNIFEDYRFGLVWFVKVT